MECPLDCPCRRAGFGAFLLAVCILAARSWPVLCGLDFGSVVAALLQPPHALPLTLAAWIAAAVLALGLTLTGIRPALEEGDTAPWLPSLAVAAAASWALWNGWYPPVSWGAVWRLSGEGFYQSLLAGAGANLCLTAAARAWIMGYRASGRPGAAGEPTAAAETRWRQIIEHQQREIAALAAERTQAFERAREAEVVLSDPAVKKSVLKVLHPDAYPNSPESKRRALTEQFQHAAAVFDRLGVR